MKTIKALNNNMVLARDGQGNECICQGKGIGLQKRSGDEIDTSLIERCFVPTSLDESRHFQQLFSEIPEEFWEIAEDVVNYGRERYGIKVSQKILLPLCDHMAGSVERYQKNVQLENPMLWDVKRIYPKEFKIGKYALEVLKKRFGIEMRDDEAAFLAWHFVNAQLTNSPSSIPPDTLTVLASHIIDMIQQSFQITLDEEDWNYQRFLTHLKFFVGRVANRQTYEDPDNLELYEELKERYPHVHQCVERIADYILIDFHYDVSTEERLYLTIHIERVTRRFRSKK